MEKERGKERDGERSSRMIVWLMSWSLSLCTLTFLPSGQANTVEETYERRDNIRHHQPIALATNEVALVGRGGAPIRQTVAIPLNMVSGVK